MRFYMTKLHTTTIYYMTSSHNTTFITKINIPPIPSILSHKQHEVLESAEAKLPSCNYQQKVVINEYLNSETLSISENKLYSLNSTYNFCALKNLQFTI